MAYLAQNFADSFGEGLGFGLRAYQAGQENIRRNAEEERQRMEYEELQRQRAAERQYGADVNELVQARSLGMPDYQATAAAASERVQAGGENYDEPRFARGMTPTVRGEPLNNTEFTKRLADLQLGAGKIDAGGYLQMQELSRKTEARDIRDNTVKAFRENPAGVVDAWSQRFNPMDSGIPIIVGERDKDGFVTLSMVDPNSEQAKGINLRLSPAQQLKVAQGVALLDAGFSDEAMELLDGVDERIGKLALTFNQTQSDLASNANRVAGTRAELAQGNERIGLARQELSLRRQGQSDARARDAAQDWQIIGASDDNKGLLRFNRRTGQTQVQPLPEGTDAKGLFARLTGERGGDPLAKTRLEAYYKALGELPSDAPRAQVDALAARFGVQQLIGGGGLPAWGTTAPATGGASTPPPPPRPTAPPPRGQVYGPLTPRSVVEAAARAGDPDAIRYLEGQQQNAIDLEIYRNDPNAYLGLR